MAGEVGGGGYCATGVFAEQQAFHQANALLLQCDMVIVLTSGQFAIVSVSIGAGDCLGVASITFHTLYVDICLKPLYFASVGEVGAYDKTYWDE